jgi:acyl carrier protein|tara:strand:+ start:17708 stop:17938 length:231 start_codon:yes stop_codon:yes gene_type:complete
MNILEFVSEIFSVEKDSLKLETAPGDFPEWDSLGHLSLLTELEERFNITFDMDETMSIQSIADLKKTLQDKGVDCS